MKSKRGFMTTHNYEQFLGVLMMNHTIVTLSSQEAASNLYHKGKLFYSTDKNPSNTHFGIWTSTGRVAILTKNRVFFATPSGEVVSLLMEKSAIDRGAKVEVVHHVMTSIAHLWADLHHIVCLSREGPSWILSNTQVHQTN